MGGDGKNPVGYEVASMLPLQIIVILAILFLVVLCCMIATQLTTGQMPLHDVGALSGGSHPDCSIQLVRSSVRC